MIFLLLHLSLITFEFPGNLLIEPEIKNNAVEQQFEILDQNTPQEEITEEDLIGRWSIQAKTNNKYRSNPHQGIVGSYFFKEDNSLAIISNKRSEKGTWNLTDKREITITKNGKTQIYRVTHFKENSMIIKYSNTYLSLKKH